jgi:secreted trypsin-like serine protease
MFTRRILITIGTALVMVAGTTLPATASSGRLAAPAHGAAPYIAGGDAASDAPWGAAVYRDGKYVCSGSVISPTWVLTAARCLSGTLSVHVGNVLRSQGTEIAVIESVASPLGGDVALLRLATPFDTTYAWLADTDPPIDSTNQICGWGTTSRQAPFYPDHIRCADVRVFAPPPNGACQDRLSGPAVCTKRIDGLFSHGDEGGPQFYEGLQVGVGSDGDIWTRQSYASVAAHRDWIWSVAGV